MQRPTTSFYLVLSSQLVNVEHTMAHWGTFHLTTKGTEFLHAWHSLDLIAFKSPFKAIIVALCV
jgi:hypothetical protein